MSPLLKTIIAERLIYMFALELTRQLNGGEIREFLIVFDIAQLKCFYIYEDEFGYEPLLDLIDSSKDVVQTVEDELLHVNGDMQINANVHYCPRLVAAESKILTTIDVAS